MTANPCPHARSAAEFITSRAVMGVEKYGHTLGDAALSPAALVRHAREEAADLLVYLTALEAALSWQPIETEVDLWKGKHRFPNCHFHCGEWLWWNTTSVDDEPSWLKVKDPTHWRPLPPAPEPEPERSGHYECLSDKPSGTWEWDEAFKPEPTRPAVTREDVRKAIFEPIGGMCAEYMADCRDDHTVCSCHRQTDAIMALIGGAQ